MSQTVSQRGGLSGSPCHNPQTLVCSCGFVAPEVDRMAVCDGWSEDRLIGEAAFLLPDERRVYDQRLAEHLQVWGEAEPLDAARYAMSGVVLGRKRAA